MGTGHHDASQLPEHIDLLRFQCIAGMRSDRPGVFAQLHHRGPNASKHRLKRFGSGTRTACLIDRGSPVLMVAHVDTVRPPFRAATIVGGRLHHNALDDRLGVYLGLEVLPAMGLQVDLLLTTGEEEGYSTAGLLRSRKKYNWMFSFDRRAEDVVCYQYESTPLTGILQASGFAVGTGTYSCIAELEHLGCCGMNFGCGMFGYHSAYAFCDLTMLDRQLRRFAAFYRKYSGLSLPYSPFTRLRACRVVHPRKA